jgi:hypothetical protein
MLGVYLGICFARISRQRSTGKRLAGMANRGSGNGQRSSRHYPQKSKNRKKLEYSLDRAGMEAR